MFRDLQAEGLDRRHQATLYLPTIAIANTQGALVGSRLAAYRMVIAISCVLQACILRPNKNEDTRG